MKIADQPIEGPESMSGPTPPSRATDRDESDTWPWECLDCGMTIYHDGEFCRACDSTHRRPELYGESDGSDGFVDWMRNQTAPGFVVRVTAVAGFELALTAFWIRTLLQMSFELASVLPIAP